MSDLRKVTSVNGELSGFCDEFARETKLDISVYSAVSGSFVTEEELGDYATEEYVDDTYAAATAVMLDMSAAVDQKIADTTAWAEDTFQTKDDYVTEAELTATLEEYYTTEETSAAGQLEDEFDRVDSEIDALENIVANFGSYKVVPDIGSVTDPSPKIIYLTKDSSLSVTDPWTEWIFTSADPSTTAWEVIGETSIDLTDYVTDTALETALEDYQPVSGMSDYLTVADAELTYQKIEDMSDYVTVEENTELSSTVNTLTAASATWDTVINKLDTEIFEDVSGDFAQKSELSTYISFNDLQFGVI